jgi:hypothetical protein
MERKRRVRAIWGLAGAVLAVAAIVVPLLVLAGSGQATLTAETYADVIRFGVQGAGTLQIQIYDLSEKELWDSGAISSDFVDWDRTDTWGERLANGYYLYLAQAWDASENLVLSRTGKVALLPGDKVQLQAAPATSPTPSEILRWEEDGPVYGPQAYDRTGNYTISGYLGVGTESPGRQITIQGPTGPDMDFMNAIGSTGNSAFRFFDSAGTLVSQLICVVNAASGASGAQNFDFLHYVDFRTPPNGGTLMRLNDVGNLGIGTTDVPARLTVQATTGDLIAAYNNSSRAPGAAVFVVTNTGDVKADGSFYGASLIVGSADVAERINTSEWVEAGDVVEIDPEHPGFFRKSSDPYSRRVAGIISTSPGVILGNTTDSETGDWDDSRPVLAIAGRVPVRVTTESGPICVGDLLVASSTPGAAMKGDPSLAIGAVVGKAMEPLQEGDGLVMAQVVLR